MKIKRLSEIERKEGKDKKEEMFLPLVRGLLPSKIKNTYTNPFAIAIDLGTFKFQPPDGVEGTEQDVMIPNLCSERKGGER